MTVPFPTTDNPDELRAQWLTPYLSVQAKTDTKFRSALITAAEQAFSRVTALDQNSSFSSGVRSAQLRLVMQVVQLVHNDLFAKFPPIIIEGQRQSASAAVSAFGVNDRRYLEAAFARSGNTRQAVSAYIAGQRDSAVLGVVNTLHRIYKSDQPLSMRVYRTRRLANQWVKNQVNAAILRNASAKQIATIIRSSIRPNVAGGVSYAALRLGRTELNNAFHATSISLAQDRPWVTGMEWHLSKTHELSTTHLAEICEIYAHTKTFRVDQVPVKPHPQCRCFVVPEVEPIETFLTHLTAGQYRDWMERNAA